MATTVTRLPDEQLRPLANAYQTALAEKRRQLVLGLVCLAAAVAAAWVLAEVDLAKLFGNITNFTDYLWRIAHFDTGAYTGQLVILHPGIGSDDWFWGLKKWSILLGETLLIAYLGTIIGGLFAFVLCFYAASSIARSPVLLWTAKRFLEFCRTVPELVFALVFVVAFGVGPIPGVLALAVHTTGALGKLFSEVVDNIDMRPTEGVIASGGTWWQMVRFAVVPQVLSNFTSYGLLRFEINVRSAGVMGYVGAGGIGQELLVSIRKFYYADVSAILVMVIVTVMLIDFLTEKLRHRLTGGAW